MKKHRKYRLRPFGIAWWATRTSMGALLIAGACGWILVFTEASNYL